MAVQCEGGGKDELKTHFQIREGTYKLMTLSEYSRPNRVGYNAQSTTPVKVSFVTIPEQSGNGDRICFNVGRELYFYMYKGVRKAADLTKPIDKRVYKGTHPTCHDFNKLTVSSDCVSLLVGFSAGQIQLIDPIRKELSKLYNEERLIDKTKVTCLKWLPGSPNQFLVSHGSGQMYVYNEELPCGTTPPHYQVFKQGEGFAVYTCKTKSTRNPLYRWVVGEGSLNEFAFSPCSKYVATVSQDGFLRVFNYDTMDLLGVARSYFGGLLCVCWSPDGRYVVSGGEDDLVTVWSFNERRIVARGHGHKSWISVVAFDPYTTWCGDIEPFDFSGSDDELMIQHLPSNHNSFYDADGRRASVLSNSSATRPTSNRHSSESRMNITSYRFGSVGQDTQLCLWDLSEDVLKQPLCRTRTSVVFNQSGSLLSKCNNQTSHSQPNCVLKDSVADGNLHSSGSITHKFATLTLVGDKKEKHDKEHKRNFSLTSRNSDKNAVLKSSGKLTDDPVKLIGTPSCPRLDDVPMLEPLVCKKITHERLTALVFREDCIVTACQEGFIYTWARPGKVGLTHQATNSPNKLVNCTTGGTVV